MMRKFNFTCYFFCFMLSFYSYCIEVPYFLDRNEIINAEFKCHQFENNLPKNNEKYLNTLWDETLLFLEGYVKALTKSTEFRCFNSATALTETNDFELSQNIKSCLMEFYDMKNIVKHIYSVLINSDAAKQCFTPQLNHKFLMSPSVVMQKNSSVAQWLNRLSMKKYFEEKKNVDLQKAGINFSNNFHKFVTGESIQMPQNFPFDISANALPHLWAAAGWVPMYSGNDRRSITAGDARFRAGYAYAEIMGPWGMLQIESINGELVGAEVGMTVQIMDTLYPYHFHNTAEQYFTIRKPACKDSILVFLISPDHPSFNLSDMNKKGRKITFNGKNQTKVSHLWQPTSPDQDAMMYIKPNYIHAFSVENSCNVNPNHHAHVTIWSRSTAHDKKNDYGTTHLCELKNPFSQPWLINSKTADIVCSLNHYIY